MTIADKPKICFVNPTLVLRRPIVELARIYAEAGYKVSVLFPSTGRIDKKFHFNKKLKHKNIKLIPIQSTYSARFRFAFPKLSELFLQTIKALKENDIMHIWEYYYPYSVLPVVLRNVANPKCRIILTTDGIIGYNYRPPEKLLEVGFKIYVHTIGRVLFGLADELTTYSKHIRKKFPKFIQSKVKIVPTGIHTKKIKFSAEARRRIREMYKISNKTKVVLFVGMLTERKRAEIVLKVAKQLKEKDIIFFIIGDGYKKADLLRRRDELKLKDRIIFLGKKGNVIDFYSACDVFFLPSLGEGLPGTVMEAMACGRPIVATRENGTIDLVNKDVGVLVKPNGNYTQALRRVLNKKFDSQKIKTRVKKWSWENVFKKYKM